MGPQKAGPFLLLNDKISLFLQPDTGAVLLGQYFL